MTLFLAMTAFGALAGEAPATATPPQPKAAAEKKICKKEELTGTRVGGRRICRTKAQWDAIQRQAQEAMEKVGTLNPGPSSN